MHAIIRSVGAWEKGAANLFDDVKTVQMMLRAASRNHNQPAWDPVDIDGMVGRPASKSATVKAISAFQSSFLANPDGLIEVNKRTWQKMVEAAESEATPGDNPNPLGLYFPFPKVPLFDWNVSPRKFASNRSGGTRAHAGCDLYFPQGTWIHAISDGTVTLGPYAFYADTFAIEVDHGTFLARYGEIQEATPVRTGDAVKAGQKIAQVGHLVGIVVPSDMLHLELYDKSQTGRLTRTGSDSLKRADGVPFQRRKDLIDPAPKLNVWKSNLPQSY